MPPPADRHLEPLGPRVPNDYRPGGPVINGDGPCSNCGGQGIGDYPYPCDTCGGSGKR
jgi:DnaJ-class molecular chaperone